jgi:ATP-binding cassette subfamily B (MDR/TAP) protein 1
MKLQIDTLAIEDYRNRAALVSQEPTLHVGTVSFFLLSILLYGCKREKVRFNILLGAVKPEAKVIQQEIS